MSRFLPILLLMLLFVGATAQVGVNTTTPDPTSALDIVSPMNDKGLLIPRMTEAQKDAILMPALGLIVFQTDVKIGIHFHNGTSWIYLSSFFSDADPSKIVYSDAANFGKDFLVNANTMDIDPMAAEEQKMMFLPSLYGSFRAGTVDDDSWDFASMGNMSFATGYNTKATNEVSTATGSETVASGEASSALGDVTMASGEVATSMGSGTSASGIVATAMGEATQAVGDVSTALGYTTIAEGIISTAMGEETTANGEVSTAMGSFTIAQGIISTAMGENTQAIGDVSTAMGFNTIASGEASTAMGDGSTASGLSSTAIGYNTVASGEASTAMGDRSIASGLGSTAIGYNSRASAETSVAMGENVHSKSFGELAVGLNNTEYTPVGVSTFSGTDRAFGVGIGADSLNRKDGLIVYKSGNTFISNDGGTPTNGTASIISGYGSGALQVRGSGDGFNLVTGTGNNSFNIAKFGTPTAGNRYISFGHLGGSISGSFAEIGRIEASGSSGVSYLTSSDVRLKNDNGVYQNGLTTVNKIKIHDYTWKESKVKDVGVFAQELYKVFPNAVSKGDEVDETDLSKIEKRWQVDYSKLVPVLVAATQELAAKNQELEKELAKYKANAKNLDLQLKEMASLKNDIEAIKAQLGLNTQTVSSNK